MHKGSPEYGLPPALNLLLFSLQFLMGSIKLSDSDLMHLDNRRHVYQRLGVRGGIWLLGPAIIWGGGGFGAL